ncbi:MAG: PD40 domain-containing protein [Flavobacteriales bacterium]|nr:PD40 domain-containing protein [Flavobacteriales bacterium]MBK6550789.1 PD40 domain-containing protein [Flavobacteriales bacterium]MBK7103385.1 PD40 domain-containing protein [Flavobacteriales bacterium]MBK7483206.1 PD40 domain-containing protein [Flavobacteriales bacterium]MBK8531287.1 PD40 domain-containing protein [Flavobacteriales bacterium]
MSSDRRWWSLRAEASRESGECARPRLRLRNRATGDVVRTNRSSRDEVKIVTDSFTPSYKRPEPVKHALLLSLATCFVLHANAQEGPLWLRNSAIGPDGSTIVFCYQGDLWRVPTSGGTAIPLTTNEAYDHSPVWSHDGKRLAFASTRYGNSDVFVMPASGGTPVRLTYHSTSEVPMDFSVDDAHVLFYGNRQDDVRNQLFPVGGLGEVYSVPSDGGRPMQLITLPLQNARYNPAGTLIVGHDRKGYEDDFRKHHTSSVTRDIWTYEPATKTFKQLTKFDGEDRNPVFNSDGSTLYYLSEESGSFNIHKMPVGGGPSIQVSAFKDHPVRYLSISNTGVLCFSYRGELYTMTDGGEPKKVNIRIHADGRYNPIRTVSVNDADEYELSSNGKEVVFVHRGEVFVSSVAEGTTRRITNTPEQERNASFSPDGRTILYASERNGSWDLYTTSLTRKEEKYFFNATVLKEEALLSTPAEEFQCAYAPDGKEVAYLEERTTLKVIDLATKKTRTVVPGDKNYSYSDGDQWYEWSPDSKWFVVSFLHSEQWIEQVGLVKATGTEPIIDLSRSGYGSSAPHWAMDGKAIVYLSDRDGMKNHASWGGQGDAYAIFLTKAAYDDLKMTKEEADLAKEEKEKKEEEKDEKAGKKKEDKKKDEEKDKKIEPLEFDLDGINDRRVRLTPNSSDLSGAILSKDGEKVWYLAAFEKGTDLWQYEMRTRDVKILHKMGDGWAGGLTLNKEGDKLFYMNEGGINYYDTEKNENKSVGINGEMLLNEGAERAYLYEHIWRQVKKKFYRVDLQGVDWDAYKVEYARYLPYINNNHDMAELCSELLGELNASHTGAGYQGDEVPNSDETAFLGLLYSNGPGPGLWISEVLDKSPVIKKDSKIATGVVIELINGDTIRADEDPARHFNRKAGKPMLLGLHDPMTKSRWVETVKPITRREESQLLYKRWVERCRHLVDSLSGGQLGYVHVRGMDDASFRVVYEEALGRYHDRKGLVVDTRFNGGGWLHDDLATFLNGEVYMRIEPRGQKLGAEPLSKWTKPSVVVMSEGNYSDAHMFPVTYRALGIGKLVGMPVAGTGTAVWWEGLQNGMWFGIPQVGMIDNNGNYLENQQLDPDVLQPLDPGAVRIGRDQQLEEAVKVLLVD